MADKEVITTRLLVVIDGSLYAESVCDYAAWVAKQLDAAVDVVHVLTRRDGGVIRRIE